MRRRDLVVAGLVLLTCLGCGDAAPDKPELGRVHGVVTLDSKPLSGVRVYFTPTTGRQSSATTNEQGEYEAMYMIDEAGVKLGECTVNVEWGPDGTGPAIPPRYGVNSELALTVKAGDNVYDIAMTSK